MIGPGGASPGFDGGCDVATDPEIRTFVQRRHGFIPKIGWIAHVTEVHGIPTWRGAARTGPVTIVTSIRARPRSGRQSKRRFDSGMM